MYKTGLQNIWLSSMKKVENNQVYSVMENYIPKSALIKVTTVVFFIAFNLFVVWSVEMTLNAFII